MNDSVSILVAVFLILIALRWMLGGGQANNEQGGQRRTAPRRMQHRVTPQMIEMVRAMFPDVPTAAIQADLQRTGSVETTVDNALRDGGLPLPPPVANQQGSPNNTNNASGSRKSPSHPNLVQRYKIDVQQQQETHSEEPAKVWESSPDKRQEMLRKRKEFMVIQARKKLLEQQEKKKEKELSNNTTQSSGSSSSSSHAEIITGGREETKPSFEEMSVDELNSLSPEQKREHMLKVLQRRKEVQQDN